MSEHLAIAPILWPFATAVLMLLLFRRNRSAQRVVSVLSALGLIALAKLFIEGETKLRRTIIRILGAMGTKNVIPVLEAFAAKDPLRVNEDDEFNMTSGGSSAEFSATWVMPLRELAKEEIQKVKARLGEGS